MERVVKVTSSEIILKAITDFNKDLAISDRVPQLQWKLAHSNGCTLFGFFGMHFQVTVAREVYRGSFCLRKILQKPTDSVPQQDCEHQTLKSGCEKN